MVDSSTQCSPEEELLPMWLTTLMSRKELAKSPLCGMKRIQGYYEPRQFSVSSINDISFFCEGRFYRIYFKYLEVNFLFIAEMNMRNWSGLFYLFQITEQMLSTSAFLFRFSVSASVYSMSNTSSLPESSSEHSNSGRELLNSGVGEEGDVDTGQAFPHHWVRFNSVIRCSETFTENMWYCVPLLCTNTCKAGYFCLSEKWNWNWEEVSQRCLPLLPPTSPSNRFCFLTTQRLHASTNQSMLDIIVINSILIHGLWPKTGFVPSQRT